MVKLGLGELEIFELLEAGLETENLSSELSCCIPYSSVHVNMLGHICAFMCTHTCSYLCLFK